MCLCIFACFHCSLTVCLPLSRQKFGRISQFFSVLLPNLKSSRNLRFIPLKTHKYSHPKCTPKHIPTQTFQSRSHSLTLVLSHFLACKLMDDSYFVACFIYLLVSFAICGSAVFPFLTMLLFLSFAYI